MQIYNVESQWNTAWGPGSAVIWDITQPPFDTFALVTLAKTRHGDSGSGAGGFAGVVSVDGDDMSGADWYPPAAFRYQMEHIQIGIVSEGQYAQCMISLLREV